MEKALLRIYRRLPSGYQKAAVQGDKNAQFNLGLMYEQGKGVAQDQEEAVKWFRQAAEQGNMMAQNNLGSIYENGKGVAQDLQKAAIWVPKSRCARR